MKLFSNLKPTLIVRWELAESQKSYCCLVSDKSSLLFNLVEIKIIVISTNKLLCSKFNNKIRAY